MDCGIDHHKKSYEFKVRIRREQLDKRFSEQRNLLL